MAERARRILVISYPQPPIPSVGGNRWRAIAKYLRRSGHDVTVLTTSLMGGLEEDEREGVVRSRDLAGSASIRRLFGRPALPPPESSPLPADTAPPATLTRLAVPDAYALSWVPFAAAAARRIVRERRVDCVVTTSPYESTHLAPLALGRGRPAWIADLRDGWTFEPHRPPFPTRAQRALDRRLERVVVERAERVVAATLPIAADLRERLGVDAAYVPNGWDPDLEPPPDLRGVPTLTPGRASLVHTGTLSGGWGRDPRPLLESLETLLRGDPTLADRLELVLVGRPSREQAELLGRYDLASVVRPLGLVSREVALALQRRASALLLLTAAGNRSEATGKLFEYLAAGRPIVALAEGNEAARIVEETGTGITVSPTDREAMIAALRRVAAAELERAYDPRGLERYRYPRPADAVADLVEEAIERRGR